MVARMIIQASFWSGLVILSGRRTLGWNELKKPPTIRTQSRQK